MRSFPHAVIAFALLAVPGASAQGVFHSVQSANLPTAEILPRGSWLFEISHRFDTPFSEGASDLWGLDGPAYNRLGLAYSPHDRVQIGVLRSNIEDNVELNAKVGVWAGGGDPLPTKVAVMGGAAFNTQVFEVDGAEDNESQLYAQLLVDALVGGRVALGVVPTLLTNQRLLDVDPHPALVVGVHGQLYVSPSMSVLAEWLATPERTDLEHDPATFGIELETRGHVFKLLVTNQARTNPTQVLAGTRTEFTPHEWRFGFNLTRLLPF
jgi:hypothetical protein